MYQKLPSGGQIQSYTSNLIVHPIIKEGYIGAHLDKPLRMQTNQ